MECGGFALCKSRMQSRLALEPAPMLRGIDGDGDGDHVNAHIHPPTVQQAVNSDISVNKHFGPHPFGGPKV